MVYNSHEMQYINKKLIMVQWVDFKTNNQLANL